MSKRVTKDKTIGYTPTGSADDHIDNVNNVSEGAITEGIADSESTMSNETDSTVNNREQI